MSLFPYLSLFLSTLILGSLISLSSSQWLLVWVGLELNLLSFVPMLTMSYSNQESEAAMKYFLSQALGSGFLLSGALNMYFSVQTLIPNEFSILLVALGLLIKLGLPPCHFWFPAVMSSISWPMCLILSTWQKIVPLFLIMYLFSAELPLFIIILIIVSSTISGLGGINQSQIKSILAYSSIGHMSWMIGGSIVSFSMSVSYFLIYSIITFSLMLSLFYASISSILSSTPARLLTPIIVASLIVGILSLGGVPPFLGFFPKWMIIQALSSFNLIIILSLLLGSMINLYYYLNMMFIILIGVATPTLINSSSKSFDSIPFISSSSLVLLSPILFIMIYAMTILN